jgi:hypothetical protein
MNEKKIEQLAYKFSQKSIIGIKQNVGERSKVHFYRETIGQKQVENIVVAGQQMLGLNDWEIKLKWEDDETIKSVWLILEQESKKATISCPVTFLQSEDGIKKMMEGLMQRLAEIATCEMQGQVHKTQKMLVNVLRCIVNN